MTAVVDKFKEMGARCVVQEVDLQGIRASWSPDWLASRAARSSARPVSLDIRRDKNGEYFLLRHRPDVQLETLQVDPKDRHLVLMARDGRDKSKFLCGHDERHWFVAAIPETTPVTTVRQAKDALRPPDVQGIAIKAKERDKRKNSGWLRQGEWFFIPSPAPDGGIVHHNEPFFRSGGQPHVAFELVRLGGHTVYTSRGRTINQQEFDDLDPASRSFYHPQTADMTVYVRGTIRHPDHATLRLRTWHRVVMNTEANARAMQHVTFVD